MIIGIVKTATIHVCENLQLACELELVVKGVHYEFKCDSEILKGAALTIHERGLCFIRFIARCMEICDVADYKHIPNSKILVAIIENKAVAIASLDGHKSFNPGEEFEMLPTDSLIF
jgi:hypothetical protein